MDNFHDWLTTTSESNARKRAVLAALRGTGPDLPGSSAACPSTNPVAMDVADEEGVVTKWKGFKGKKKKKEEEEGDDDSEDDSQSECVTERAKSPDYSIDKVLRDLEGFRTDVEKKLGDLDKEEGESDKKKDDIVKQVKQAKKVNPAPKVDDEDEEESEEEDKTPWQKFKDKKDQPWKIGSKQSEKKG